MKELQKMKRASLIMHRSSMITLLLLFYAAPAIANDFRVITPNQNFEFVTLLSGNAINISNTQVIPFEVHSVFVTSIGNKALSANLQNFTGAGSGLWFIYLFGTGGKTWADFSMGVIPATGPAAVIDIGSGLGFALATVSLFVTSPVAVDNPLGFTLRIAP